MTTRKSYCPHCRCELTVWVDYWDDAEDDGGPSIRVTAVAPRNQPASEFVLWAQAGKGTVNACRELYLYRGAPCNWLRNEASHVTPCALPGLRWLDTAPEDNAYLRTLCAYGRGIMARHATCNAEEP